MKKILPFLLIIYACTNQVPKQEKAPLHPNSCERPFDTTAFIQTLPPVQQDSIHLATRKDLDTLELVNLMYACKCAQWYIHDTTERPYGHNPTTGYFLHAAHPSLDLGDHYRAGTVIKFIGYTISPSKEEIAKLDKQTGDFQIPGRKLYYYAYQIQKPYRVWGPDCFQEVYENALDVQDSLFRAREVTVR